MTTTIIINPDDHHILSATAEEVILRGELDWVDGPCILRVSRVTYFAAMTDWLDHKAEYARGWKGEFCGVGGISFEGTLAKGKKAWLRDDDDNPVNVKTYTATEFFVDMEHG